MSALSPAWKVLKGGTFYPVASSGSNIIYRPNASSEATLKFNNNADDFDNIFIEEDLVELYIGNVKMLEGYIDDHSAEHLPNNAKNLLLHLTDWGSYLAGKTIHEREYKRTTTAEKVILNASAEIAGMSTQITGLQNQDQALKRAFNGTYVKDAIYSACESSGGEYFFDELKVLRAFDFNSRSLSSGSGTYRIRDVEPSLARDLVVDHNFAYKFANNVTNKYRSVVATNGIFETYPATSDTFQEKGFKEDYDGKRYSEYFKTQQDYSIDVTEIEPCIFEPSTDCGEGLLMPTLKVVLATTGNASILIRPYTRDAQGNLQKTTGNFNLGTENWQRIGMFINMKGMLGQTSTNFNVRLATDAGNFWIRDILNDLNSAQAVDIGGTGFTYVEYQLPANIIDTISNGWTKVNNPNIINMMFFEIAPSSGWTPESYIEFGKVHFMRRRRASRTTAGLPATQKIIVDGRSKSQKSLDTLALKEHERSDVVAMSGNFTIDGNTDFRKPAYMIDVDFTQTLGTGKSGNVRINQIRHTLSDGVHKTNVFFNNSFNRP